MRLRESGKREGPWMIVWGKARYALVQCMGLRGLGV